MTFINSVLGRWKKGWVQMYMVGTVVDGVNLSKTVSERSEVALGKS